jgi:hypothetical protein
MLSPPTGSAALSIRTSSTGPAGPVNFARFVFLDSRSKEFFADWERAAKDCAALLRLEAGRVPYDRELSDLVGELSTQSEEFRDHWAAHNVRLHNQGIKQFSHPVVGDLELSYNRVELPGDPELAVIAYTPEPGSKSADGFSLLASWAATEDAHGTIEGGAEASESEGGAPASQPRN